MCLISDKDLVDLSIGTLDGKCSKSSLNAYRKFLEEPNVLKTFKQNFRNAIGYIVDEQVKKWSDEHPDYIKAMAKLIYANGNDSGTVIEFQAKWFNSSYSFHRGLTFLCTKEQLKYKKTRPKIYAEIEKLLDSTQNADRCLLINELLAYDVGRNYLMPGKTALVDLTELYVNALNALIVDNKPKIINFRTDVEA